MALPSTTPNILGNAALTAFDTIVIGSGAAGSTVARTLAKAGQRVLILEAGDNYFPGLDTPDALPAPLFSNDELKLRVRGMIDQDPVIEPRSFRARESEGVRTLVGDVNGLPRNVGGAAVHAAMKYPRFQPTDFQLQTLLGPVPDASFADWPVGYGTLERYYVEIEHLVGVQGAEGANADPFAPAKSRSYPMPPGLPMYANTILANAARRLGYHPFAYPTAINSRPYRGRPACVDCGFCAGYGCPTNAKGAPAVTLLRDALLTGRVQLRYNAAVTRLVPNATSTGVSEVEYLDPDGCPRHGRGRSLRPRGERDRDARACSCCRRRGPRQLVGPRRAQPDVPLPDDGDRHAPGSLHGHRGRSVTTGLADFRGVPGDPDRPLGGIVELATSAEPDRGGQVLRARARLRPARC